MPPLNSQTIVPLLAQTNNIRNICIIAHVDHGKTTLADALLANNHIISSKATGTRYLDGRADEQEKGITMENSNVSLTFTVHQEDDSKQNFLINLIDSPGHVDFSAEVMNAAKLADGSLLLLDVIEGICTQTHAVLHQTHLTATKPLLVLTKIDRMITELKLSPLEAYIALEKLITQVNAILGSFYIQDRADIEVKYSHEVGSDAAATSIIHMQRELDDLDSQQFEFDPRKGNVVFSAATDGWACRTEQFAVLYSAKLGISPLRLNDGLWGPNVYDSKSKQIVTKDQHDPTIRPLFVQLVLENIWKIYDTVLHNQDVDATSKICKTLNIRMNDRELRQKDKRLVLRTLMSQWLPLSSTVMLSVSEHLPSPIEAQPYRMLTFLDNPSPELCVCTSEGPMLGYVAKMLSLTLQQLHLPQGEADESTQRILGLTRILQGTIHVGDEVYCIDAQGEAVIITGIYVVMGADLLSVSEVPAGNICAIDGLHPPIHKYGTIASRSNTISLSPPLAEKGIVRVAIEPQFPKDMHRFTEGLKSLSAVDTALDVNYEAGGEMTISVLGELHLTRILEDLATKFAQSIPVNVSPPIVEFREVCTSSDQGTIPSFLGDPASRSGLSIKRNGWSAEIQLWPLPFELWSSLDAASTDVATALLPYMKMDPWCRNSISWWLERLIVKKGSNMLFDISPSTESTNHHALSTGFQHALSFGPLMAEPCAGIVITLQNLEIDTSVHSSALTGSIITGFKESIHSAILGWSPRIACAVYRCEIRASSDVLGKVYSVISRRKGIVLEEGMIEGSAMFLIRCRLPVIESFGFADELRKKSSGLAHPLLLFDGWSVIEADPFWTPTTAEEMEEMRDKTLKENTARGYWEDVRSRKGLSVERKMVEDAEKQRTHKMNK